MVQFLLKRLFKQRFLAVHHDFHWFSKPNFIPVMLRSRKFWKGRSWSRILYLWLATLMGSQDGWKTCVKHREKDKKQQKMKRVATFHEKPMNNLESRAVNVGRWSEVWSNIEFQVIRRQIHPTVTQIRHQVVPQMEGASELKEKRTVIGEK